MNIIKYEFLKVLNKKTFGVLFSVLFFMNLFLYYSSAAKHQNIIINNKERYYELESMYNDKSIEVALNEITLKEKQLNNYNLLLNVDDETIKEFVEQIEKENPELISNFTKSEYFNNSNKLMIDSYFVTLIKEQLSYINNYDYYIETMEEKSKKLLSISIFQDKKQFSYKNINKTSKDFEILKDIKLSLGLGNGINTSTNFIITDIFVIIIIFILCIYLFILERESGLFILIKCNKKGKLSVIIAKTIVLITFTILTSLVFYGFTLLLGNFLYGFGDISRNIQSLSDFRECNILLTVKEYLILYLVCKILINIVIGFIFSFIFLVLKNSMEIYLTSILVLTFNFVFYTFIIPTSYINILKYVNIFSFLNVHNLLGEYKNINFFGNPINLIVLYKIVCVILLIGLFITIVVLFVNSSSIGEISNIEIFINNLKLKLFKNKGTSALFFQEAYKIMIYNKALIIIVLITIVLSNSIIKLEKHFTSDEVTYRNYIVNLRGELTSEKVNYINKEKEKFNKLYLELEKIDIEYSNKEISAKQYNERKNKLNLIKSKEKVFNEVLKQYDYIISMKDTKDIDVHFIDIMAYENIFQENKNTLIVGIIITIFIILLLSNIFAIDLKNGAIKIIGCSKYGKTKACLYKYLISFTLIGIIFSLINLYIYLKIYKIYGLNNFNAPVQSIQIFRNFPFEISIGNFILLKDFLMFLGLCAIGIFVLMISSIFKNYLITVIISTIMIIIPLMVSFINLESIRYITFNNIFMLGSTLNSFNGIIICTIYYIMLTFTSVIFIKITLCKYKHL